MIINVGLLGQISALLVFFTIVDGKGFDQNGNRIDDDKCEFFFKDEYHGSFFFNYIFKNKQHLIPKVAFSI